MYDYFSLYYHVFRFQIIHSKCISTHSVINLTVHIYLKVIMGRCRRGAPIRPKSFRPKEKMPRDSETILLGDANASKYYWRWPVRVRGRVRYGLSDILRSFP